MGRKSPLDEERPSSAEALLGESSVGAAGKGRLLLGYLCIFVVIVTWIAQSEVAQALETSSYNRPYIITLVNHSLGMLQVLVLLCGPWRESASLFLRAHGARLLLQVLGVCVAYQAADWVWYIGLSGTSVAAGTIIFNSMSVFVFLFEWLLGRRRFSTWKGGAVVVSLLGVVIVERKPGENNASLDATQAGCLSQFGANMLVLVAAVLYAAYQVAVDAILPSSDPGTTNAFVALSGLVTCVALWPGAFLLAAVPKGGCLYEPLDLPGTGAIAGLAATGLLAFAFNVFFCFAIVLTSPLVTAVGCMFTVPAGLLTDYFLHGDSIEPSAIIGSGLILVGFLAIAWQGDQKSGQRG